MLVATIGNFDGVHLGHQAIVAAARTLAGHAGRVHAVTFDPLPVSVLRPESAPLRLTSSRQRERLLREAGCDAIHVLDPRSGILSKTPQEFIDSLRHSIPFDAIAEGGDFRFGNARSGDIDSLRSMGTQSGFIAHEVPEVYHALLDGTVIAARSSSIRWLLAMGRVADAAALLGRPYSIEGTVVQGDQRGRQLGVPTANIDAAGLVLPADGVYRAEGTVDGVRWPAAVSIGVKPTFGGALRVCEAHLLGFPGSAGPVSEYGWKLQIDFLDWIRGQWKFPKPELLSEQLRSDIAKVASLA